jgi:hypothetical protein
MAEDIRGISYREPYRKKEEEQDLRTISEVISLIE